MTAFTGVDGIMGLGFDTSAGTGGAQTVVTNMLLQNQIDEPIVSVWLNKMENQDPKSLNGGFFIFGGVDPSLFTGPITYAPVTSSKSWEIKLDKIFLGKRELELSSSARRTIIDTGSSYILFPEYLTTAFHRAIPNAQYDERLGWLVPCTLANSKSVGNLAFVISGQRFQVPLSDIVILRSAFKGMCLSAIDSWSESGDYGGQSGILLGDLFIKNQYIVYDYGKKQIGFAEKVELPSRGLGLNANGEARSQKLRPSIIQTILLAGWATTTAMVVT
ncbi:hypothetical protein BGW38_008282, partial [Lunasporangiospora selenospora]